MASERIPASSLKRAKRKRIRQNDLELERFNSLPWNSSLSEDDPFSLLAGSNELEGGFLSLEEIDEVQYGLEVPKPEIEYRKEKEKSKRSEESVKKSAGDEVGVEVEGEPESVKKKMKKKKKKKRKQKKTKKKAEEPEKDEGAGDNDSGDGVESIEVDENENEGNMEGEDDKSMDVSNGEDVVEEELVDVEEYYAWNELRLHPMIMKSIYGLGFKEPTPIQKACIPAAAHQGKDVVGAAETGSGKTLAFGLPIFQRLLEEQEKAARMVEERGVDRGEKVAPEGLLRALIITPTRELANQVTAHLKAVSKDTNFRVVAIVGGMSLDKQARLLKLRPEVVVGTPGRLWELMNGGEKHFVELHSLSFFVLDEADRMIENGHFHELRFIIDRLPLLNGSTDENLQNTQSCETHLNVQRKKRQTFVFSATIALSTDFRKKLKRGALKPKQSNGMESIETLSQRAGMRDNVAVFDLTNDSILANRLEESFIECREEDKDAYLYYILSVHGQGSTIVFCTSIAALRHLSSIMRTLGVNVLTLHAQMQQRARLKAIDRFRGSKNENESRVLLATDVAARGIDIPGVRTVVHYQLPHSAEVYVHRSGRTARASADGCSIALIAPKETSKFASLCKSFSKDSFQRFPFDVSYMPEIMKRLSLARQIDKILRKDSKEKAKKSWLERNAESIDFDIEGDESDDERANSHKQKKVTSANVKKLQQELKELLSRPLQPKTFSRRYFAGAGVSHLLQNQFQELANKQNLDDNPKSGESKRRKLVVIGQERVEPLQALRTAGQEVHMDIKEVAQKRKNMEILRRKRKEEKKRLRDQKRKQRKKMKAGV